MQSRNAGNTNKSTKTAITMLRNYIAEKGLPDLDETPNENLQSLLEQFYINVHTKDGKKYHTQSMKSIRSGLNRWFKEKKK